MFLPTCLAKYQELCKISASRCGCVKRVALTYFPPAPHTVNGLKSTKTPSLEDQAILNRVVVAEPLTHGRVGARELPIGVEKTHAVDHDIHVPDVFAMH